MEGYLKVVAEDNPATLVKISSLLCRKGYEVKSLTFGPDSSQGLSLFNIVLRDNGKEAIRILKQINKLIEVVEVRSVEPEGVTV